MENCTKLVQNKIKNTPKTKYDAQDTSVSWLLARYSLLSYTPFTLTPEISKTKVLLLHSPVVAHKTWKWNTIPTPLDSDFEWPHARLPPDFFQDPIREMCIPKLNIFPPPLPPHTHTAVGNRDEDIQWYTRWTGRDRQMWMICFSNKHRKTYGYRWGGAGQKEPEDRTGHIMAVKGVGKERSNLPWTDRQMGAGVAERAKNWRNRDGS